MTQKYIRIYNFVLAGVFLFGYLSMLFYTVGPEALKYWQGYSLVLVFIANFYLLSVITKPSGKKISERRFEQFKIVMVVYGLIATIVYFSDTVYIISILTLITPVYLILQWKQVSNKKENGRV